MNIKRFVLGPISTNVYLAADEESKKAFLVDPAFAYDKLVEEINERGLDLEYIIITHGHGDHTDGLSYYKKAFPNAKVLASKLEKNFLYNRDQSMGKGGIVADKWIEDGEELSVGNMNLKFLSTPGHTPGGMSIYVENVVFCGDTLFHTSVGRTDLYGGNWDQLLDSIKVKLFSLPDDTKVLPGHDAFTTIAYEKSYNPFCL